MVMTKYIHRVCNNICEITIVKRSPEFTVDGKCLSVKII